VARLCLESLLQVREQGQRELGKVWRAVILERDVHSLPDLERHVGWAWNCQSVETFHNRVPFCWGIGIAELFEGQRLDPSIGASGGQRSPEGNA
jgi:hypothetical protein